MCIYTTYMHIQKIPSMKHNNGKDFIVSDTSEASVSSSEF